MSGHLCFASLARLPDRSTKCRPASAGASNRAVGPASNPFPSGLLPSGIGMAKPTIQQARDRAEWLAISARATPLTLPPWRGIAMLRLLYPSSSSVWKHWNLVFRFHATRAILSRDRGDDALSLQVACPDLMRCVGYNLHAGKDSSFDCSADRMMGYA